MGKKNKIEITLTKDMLALISNIHFCEVPDTMSEKNDRMSYGIDMFSLYGGDFLFEDVSLILGFYDKRIPETTDDAFGPRFPQELEDYMVQMHGYIVENIEYIESLVHYYCNKGGLTEGTYTCKSYDLLWTKVD